jgi:DNA-binding NarL/FixJ family response regulator
MPAAGTPDILVVDGDDKFRAFLRVSLERAGFGVLEAANGEEALALRFAQPPRLAVIDVCLTGINGFEVFRTLQERVARDLPVVFVSAERRDRVDRVSALLLGADDYFTKPLQPDELIARIRRSLAGSGKHHANGIGESADDTGSPFSTLTPREREVLVLLADGLDQRQIAARLVVSTRTVGTHVQHILSKLEVHSRVHAVALALRHGMAGAGAGDRITTGAL